MGTCILFIVSRAILNFQIDMVKRTPSLYTTRYLTFIFTWQVAAWPNFYTPEREVCLPSHWIATMVPHRYWTGGLRNDPVWNSFYTDIIVSFLTILTAGQQLAVMEQLTCAARESCTKVSSGLYVSILWRLFYLGSLLARHVVFMEFKGIHQHGVVPPHSLSLSLAIDIT